MNENEMGGMCRIHGKMLYAYRNLILPFHTHSQDLVSKPRTRRPLMKYKDYNKIEFRETGLKRIGRFELAQCMVQQGVILSTTVNIRVLMLKEENHLVILEIINMKKTFT
jgi:hypothetical protein